MAEANGWPWTPQSMLTCMVCRSPRTYHGKHICLYILYIYIYLCVCISLCAVELNESMIVTRKMDACVCVCVHVSYGSWIHVHMFPSPHLFHIPPLMLPWHVRRPTSSCSNEAEFSELSETLRKLEELEQQEAGHPLAVEALLWTMSMSISLIAGCWLFLGWKLSYPWVVGSNQTSLLLIGSF